MNPQKRHQIGSIKKLIRITMTIVVGKHHTDSLRSRSSKNSSRRLNGKDCESGRCAKNDVNESV